MFIGRDNGYEHGVTPQAAGECEYLLASRKLQRSEVTRGLIQMGVCSGRACTGIPMFIGRDNGYEHGVTPQAAYAKCAIPSIFIMPLARYYNQLLLIVTHID